MTARIANPHTIAARILETFWCRILCDVKVLEEFTRKEHLSRKNMKWVFSGPCR